MTVEYYTKGDFKPEALPADLARVYTDNGNLISVWIGTVKVLDGSGNRNAVRAFLTAEGYTRS